MRLPEDAPDKLEFHDLLKARGMSIGRPLQVSRPGTLGGDVQRYRLDGTPNLEMQDEASRAWNFFCALYYKAGGTPWRYGPRSYRVDNLLRRRQFLSDAGRIEPPC